MRVELSKSDLALLRTCVNAPRWSSLLQIAGRIIFFVPWLFVWPFVRMNYYNTLGPLICGVLLMLCGGQQQARWFTAVKNARWFNLCHLAEVDTATFREAVKVVRVGWDENGNLEEYVDAKAVKTAEAAALRVNEALGSPVEPLNVGLIWTLAATLALVVLLVLAGLL